jgi:hypothetical protein
MPAFQPYWGKLAVRNDRGDRGNVGIIRSPVRASILPDQNGRESDSGDAIQHPEWAFRACGDVAIQIEEAKCRFTTVVLYFRMSSWSEDNRQHRPPDRGHAITSQAKAGYYRRKISSDHAGRSRLALL